MNVVIVDYQLSNIFSLVNALNFLQIRNKVSSNKIEPHRILVYLYELSSDFHTYWNMGKENEKLRFTNKDKKLSDEKLVFLKATSMVIKSGMNIVGVNTPEKM